jgi:hypothetical protein
MFVVTGIEAPESFILNKPLEQCRVWEMHRRICVSPTDKHQAASIMADSAAKAHTILVNLLGRRIANHDASAPYSFQSKNNRFAGVTVNTSRKPVFPKEFALEKCVTSPHNRNCDIK